ncbi:MAG TPA: LysE family translocator [Gammaproteobacteria bacterium]|jgi:threonine/homoserine/homoserine lactone efflux protein
MHSGLTASGMIALFGTMAVLAAIPSVSVLVVSARSASFGFIHGVSAALGIVAGDIVYIALAIFGLSVLVEAMGEGFVLVKYLGGAYLVWLGVALWRSKPRNLEAGDGTTAAEPALFSSFLAGLLLTLGDQKAILFYLGFFPAFLDLSALTWVDAVLIIAVTVVAVGGVKIAYAWMAGKAGLLIGSERRRSMCRAAGGILMLVGTVVILKG